ncbi:PREDICTED: thioredoxin, mitochondrial [Bactrocera latifrons]|uniref:Thioredoxin, mitochondrial n=1 Tax=Bactrocera latifrons TaxID=174628 RepID=A0A0K8V6A6_BACLA|nr:PREDICTED: thioredoxin, mitochondrial [Bactrocera latifrons]
MFLNKLNNLGRQLANPALRAQARSICTTIANREIFQVQSAEDFDEKVKKSDKPVIVDFFATWCNPCKMLTPRIETVVGEKAGAIKLAKVDIDEHSELALDYDVGAVPVLLVMKEGKVVNRMVGLQDTDKIRAWIDKAVEGAK